MQNFLSDLTYDYGFCKPMDFDFQGKKWNISLFFQADSKDDQLTVAQTKAFETFYQDRTKFEKLTEDLVADYIEANNFNDTKVKPKTLFIDESGVVAVLCDCAWDNENGIAVVLAPKSYVTTQDDVL